MAVYVYYKGSLSDKLLFGLIVRIYKLSMYGDMILYVIWVLETWMIECGIYMCYLREYLIRAFWQVKIIY